MRDGLVNIAACAGLIACTARWPIFLPPPYNAWPPAPPGTPIEPAGLSVSIGPSGPPSRQAY
jgi:hypothetical protein